MNMHSEAILHMLKVWAIQRDVLITDEVYSCLIAHNMIDSISVVIVEVDTCGRNVFEEQGAGMVMNQPSLKGFSPNVAMSKLPIALQVLESLLY